MNDADIVCMNLYPDMTDEEIKECIHQAYPVVIARARGFCLSLGGFDNDPRELWEIPQAVTFFRRLINFGFISCLEVSTTVKEMATYPDLPGFGALEVWLCGTGRMRKGKFDIGQEEMATFMEDLKRSNMVVELVLDQPRPQINLKQTIFSTQVDDAPMRFRGIRTPRFRKDRSHE